MLTIPELLFQIETEIMTNMIIEINKGKATPARWKAERLASAGKLSNENLNIIKKYEQSILNGTATEILNSQNQALKQVDTMLNKAIEFGVDLAPPQAGVSEAIQKVTNEFANQGGKDMNYTMQSMLKSSNQIYRDTISKASLKLAQGYTTLDEAIKVTCKTWVNAGSLLIKDSANRIWSPESYSSMLIRTANRNVTTNVQLERNKEYGNDLIEISSHTDARELCAPYQGKIYTTGRNKNYPRLSSTSYGEPAGLFGINCRHEAYPYVEGISLKAYDPSPFNEEAYRQSQQQRYLEREIRNNKRQLELSKKLGDEKQITKYKAKVSQSQSNMRDFINRTGATRQYNREQIFT
jgi:hypothetical protein